jgi:hypothetical protein
MAAELDDFRPGHPASPAGHPRPMCRQPCTRCSPRIEGVELTGEVADPLGRRWVAVSTSSFGPNSDAGVTTADAQLAARGTTRFEAIFDQSTGMLLATREILTKRVDWADAGTWDRAVVQHDRRDGSGLKYLAAAAASDRRRSAARSCTETVSVAAGQRHRPVRHAQGVRAIYLSVHPTCHNPNTPPSATPLVSGPVIQLPSRHGKVRRDATGGSVKSDAVRLAPPELLRC